MTKLRQRSRGRRGLLYLGTGVVGAITIVAAAAWACTPVANTATVVSPNSTNVSGNVGVNVNSYTTHSDNVGLAMDNYWIRVRPFGLSTACEHTAALGSSVQPSGGDIGSVGSQYTRTLTWSTIYDGSGEPGDVCWSNGQPGQSPSHASEPTDFTIN